MNRNKCVIVPDMSANREMKQTDNWVECLEEVAVIVKAAGMTEEYERADDKSYQPIIFAAADKLGVNIVDLGDRVELPNGKRVDFEDCADLMDDEIRKEITKEDLYKNDKQGFIDEYIKRHAEKYNGEVFGI